MKFANALNFRGFPHLPGNDAAYGYVGGWRAVRRRAGGAVSGAIGWTLWWPKRSDWLGTPYRHQGRRKGVGCDCLGLVLGVWRGGLRRGRWNCPDPMRRIGRRLAARRLLTGAASKFPEKEFARDGGGRSDDLPLAAHTCRPSMRAFSSA